MSDPPSSGEPRPEGRPSTPQFQVRIPLEWQDADDVPIVYANQVLVSHMGPEFFVTLGVVLPPASPDALPDQLSIQPQVRVAVSREAMPAIIKALNDSLRRYQQALAQKRESSNADAGEDGRGAEDGEGAGQRSPSG